MFVDNTKISNAILTLFNFELATDLRILPASQSLC